MRFLMLLKADKDTEAGVLPTAEQLSIMGKYNKELIDAGVMIDGVGLQPTSKGARVRFEGGQASVTDGPFTETKELIAGYWVIQVNSKDEAIEWAKRVPSHILPQNDGTAEIELRQVYEITDFPEVPPEVAEMDAAFEAGRQQRAPTSP
jgi:hypothetical protein